MSFAYRVATGHISVVTIQGSDSYLLSSRSRPSDMPSALEWSMAVYPVVRDYVVRRKTLGNKYALEGDTNFDVVISAMTPGMYAAWVTDFFPSGVESKEFTIQIGDKRFLAANETKVYQGMLHKPEPGSFTFLPRSIPVSTPVTFPFDGATLIT